MRKILMGLVAALIALFGLFGVQINLVSEIDPTNIIAALLIVGVWIFTEFKKDWTAFKLGVQQTNKWSDPAFWTAAITSVALPLLTAFKIALTDQVISIASALLAVLVPVLVNLFRKDTTTPA